MKLLFILPRMVAGGVERVTLSLIEGLQQEGADCALALRRAYGEFLPEAQKLCPVHEVAAKGMQHRNASKGCKLTGGQACAQQ